MTSYVPVVERLLRTTTLSYHAERLPSACSLDLLYRMQIAAVAGCSQIILLLLSVMDVKWKIVISMKRASRDRVRYEVTQFFDEYCDGMLIHIITTDFHDFLLLDNLCVHLIFLLPEKSLPIRHSLFLSLAPPLALRN